MFIYCSCCCICRIDFQGHDTTVVLQGDIKVLEQYCASMFLKMTLISSGRWCTLLRNVDICWTTLCDFPDGDSTNINRWENMNLTTNIILLLFVFC
jgi:hypothetical protein